MYKIDFGNPIHVYFVGIGGVSMSGLALILAGAGFKVSGSDRSPSDTTAVLENAGIKVFYGQAKANITSDIDCAVFTAAIREDNPEFIAVKELGIPSLTRAELLGQIMKNYKTSIAVSGTHGKTTTTSMLGKILLDAGCDPTVSVGGQCKALGGNLRKGNGDVFITEACEYTNSFLSFFPTFSLIMNIEEDHLDFFKDIEDIRNSFKTFAKLLPNDGTLVINSEIDDLSAFIQGLECNVVTFGPEGTGADYSYSDVTYNKMGCASFTITHDGKCTSVSLKVPGIHNVKNATAAFASVNELAIDTDAAIESLSTFAGTDRRFEYKGTIGGVTIVDDYSHHPTEIVAALTAARKIECNKLWVIFQPHTYTRTKAFLTDFAKALSLADHVILAPIYAAREKNTLGVSSADIQKEIIKLGKPCECFETFDEIENFVLLNCINNDMLITMGAGDVVNIGESLLGQK